ncbi:MAG: hypothetical protein ACR2F1_15400 [Nitrososphaeraceae archaeon]
MFKPSILVVIIIRGNTYKKILNHRRKHKESAKSDNSNSILEPNYLWATQDIDSKEFYEKIKSNPIAIT